MGVSSGYLKGITGMQQRLNHVAGATTRTSIVEFESDTGEKLELSFTLAEKEVTNNTWRDLKAVLASKDLDRAYSVEGSLSRTNFQVQVGRTVSRRRRRRQHFRRKGYRMKGDDLASFHARRVWQLKSISA